MAFQKLPDNRGVIFIPERITGGCSKHNCPDCFSCRWCGNERCKVCKIEPRYFAQDSELKKYIKGRHKTVQKAHDVGRRRSRPDIKD